jgi:XTP/dITP diphosphohydrolase
MQTNIDTALQSFRRLLEIMDELREKCPWDREQTFESLRTLTIEETYELADAIAKENPQSIKKELGDILLHIVFYAKIGSETGDFTIDQVIDGLSEKLIYRHPHIFGNDTANTPQDVKEKWEQLKLKEKGGNKTVLEGVPAALPAMIKAHRMQDKARGVGFDWEQREQVWDKVEEELAELKVEIEKEDQANSEAELGDFLFSVINAARLYHINPENALEKTNAKFIRRFNYLEQQTIQKGVDLKKMNLDEMNAIWDEAKAKGL